MYMEYTSPKIRFYRERTFGEKLNITFDYLRDNWRPMLRFSLYLILPLCFVQSFFLNQFTEHFFIDLAGSDGDIFTSILPRIILGSLALFVCYFVGYILLSALLYGLMQLYERCDGGLRGLTFAELRAPLGRMIGRSLRLMLFGVLMTVAVVLIVVAPAVWISPWTLLLTLPLILLVVLLVASPIWLLSPLYLLGDRPFFASVRQSFQWGFRAWFEVFGLMLIFGLIGSIINMVTYLPWYFFTFFSQLVAFTSDSPLSDTLWYQLLSYILGIIQSYGYYLSQVIALTGIAFEYFHLREKHEGLTAHADIASFSQL